MNSITINFDNDTDLNLVYKQLKKLYPKGEIIKNAEKDENRAIRAMEEMQKLVKGKIEQLGIQSEEEFIKWMYDDEDEIRSENK